MPQPSHLKKTIQSFERLSDLENVDVHYGEPEIRVKESLFDELHYPESAYELCPKKISRFIIQSHINYLEGEIEFLVGRKKELGDLPLFNQNISICGVGSEIQNQITHLKSQLKEAKKML
jgi:hypothetical protein